MTTVQTLLNFRRTATEILHFTSKSPPPFFFKRNPTLTVDTLTNTVRYEVISRLHHLDTQSDQDIISA